MFCINHLNDINVEYKAIYCCCWLVQVVWGSSRMFALMFKSVDAFFFGHTILSVLNQFNL